MRKHATLIAAAVLVLIANAFALLGAYLNRAGASDAEFTLSERELVWRRDPNNTAVLLNLRLAAPRDDEPWLDREKLGALGFDVSADPRSEDALRHYSRQHPLRVYAAFELSGEPPFVAGKPDPEASRLAAIDADQSASALRRRHPDRTRVLILPAAVRPSLQLESQVPAYRPARLSAHIVSIPAQVHVPRPHSDVFLSAPQGVKPRYHVTLRTGARLEPWVTKVEFTGVQ